ncbi:MAG: hypothetical protein ACYC1M_05115 [Armatimonadota bacterium]
MMNELQVDFSYAFGLPHRMTVALPDSSDKTLIDVFDDRLEYRWTYSDLKNTPLGAFMPLNCNWSAKVWVEVDGEKLKAPSYQRSEGYLPVLSVHYGGSDGRIDMEAVGGESAALTRITVANTSDQDHRYTVVCSINGPFGEVPGYINDGDDLDYALAGWNERADHVLMMAEGGVNPLRRDTPAKTFAVEWSLAPGETASGWLVRPYRACVSDTQNLRAKDWSLEFEQGKQAWRELISKAVKYSIPDIGVRNAYYAGLADIFIMREPVADGYIACSPGTECYRCPNSGEASMAAVGLDQAGLHHESAIGYQISLDMQGENGDWNDPAGWSHGAWGMAGFKAWAAMEHFKLTGDTAYLEAVYPRMLACSRWQETQRQRTRVLVDGEMPLHYGMMPRGQGDCGLDAGDGLYGYFIPHNVWAVYCDKLTLEAAVLLGRKDDVKECEAIYHQAHTELVAVMERGAIQEEDYRWIPGSPSNPVGSRWGALNTAFPCEVLPADHELITGTLKYMNKQLSPGGLQIHTGWMVDGMWVAMSLDNVAEVELMRGNGDEAVRLLYATLNHGTPLYSWCEERGQEPGTEQISGDIQHLWTPAAVVRAVRDCMVMEKDGGLHLALGTGRQWLGGGCELGIENAPTHWGCASYCMKYDAAAAQVTARIQFPSRQTVPCCVLHVRLPEGLCITTVNAESAAIINAEGSTLEWQNPQGAVDIVMGVAPRHPKPMEAGA